MVFVSFIAAVSLAGHRVHGARGPLGGRYILDDSLGNAAE